MTTETHSRLAWLHEPPRAIAEIGGKAAQLGALVRAGLPVPEGFVIPVGFCLGEQRFRAAILEAAQQLAGPLMVRSSATVEDAAGAPFPGVFESVAEVAPTEVVAAAERVRASAGAPAAKLYAEALDIDAKTVAMAVVVQRQVARPRARGTVYTRLPGQPSAGDLMVEADVGGTRFLRAEVSRDEPHKVRFCQPGFPLSPDETSAIARASLAAEGAIDAAETGADVEWLWAADRMWLVQARPIAHGVAQPVFDLASLPAGARDKTWVWDATHNPDPLSLAQIGLVERVDAAASPNAARMRVIGGYLYTSAPDGSRPPPLAAGELCAAWQAMSATCERLLSDLAEPAALPDSLRVYEEIARLHGAFSARLGDARAALVKLIADAGLNDPEAVASRIVAAGSGDALTRAARAGDHATVRELAAELAAAWDVAAPAYGEDPDRLERAIAALTGRARGPEPERMAADLTALRAAIGDSRRDELARLIDAATVAHDLAEDDDRWFFRAQAAVRRSLLAIAHRWRLLDPGDIFHLPLAETLARAESNRAPDPDEVAARATVARATIDRQMQTSPPAVIAPPQHPHAETIFSLGRAGPGLWRGRGTGGQVRGRVVKLVDRGHIAPGAADIAVVKTVTPGLALFASSARGLVSEHGGLLGHGAALARQLKIPCVVGCRGIFAELTDGDLVAVDADAGLVAQIHRAS